MPHPLTSKQADFFRMLLSLRKKHGVPPTIRELCEAGGYGSPRSVTQFLEALEAAGYIRRGDGARNVRILHLPPEPAVERARTVDVPVVGTVAAGLPILAVENIEAVIPVSEKIARPPHRYFFLHVKGDSMNRAGIKHGSLALVRQQETARAGENVVALIDDDATIKRLKLAGGMVILEPVSSNPEHKPIVMDRDFRVQGVVVTTLPLKV